MSFAIVVIPRIPMPAPVILRLNKTTGKTRGIESTDISVALFPPFDAIEETKVKITLTPNAPKITPNTNIP